MFLDLRNRLSIESFRRVEYHVHTIHGHHVRFLT